MTTPRLRRYTNRDAIPLRDAVRRSHARMSRWLPWAHAEYGLADEQTFIAAAIEGWRTGEGPFELAIVMDEAFAGGIRIRPLAGNRHAANLGYWVSAPFQGRGVASAAAQAVSNLAFRELAIQHLEIVASRDNLASRRVAEKLGAHLLGPAIEHAHEAGHTEVDVVYALTAVDLVNVRGSQYFSAASLRNDK